MSRRNLENLGQYRTISRQKPPEQHVNLNFLERENAKNISYRQLRVAPHAVSV